MKHIICYSGGHSSGLVALEVAKKFGIKDLILLNHNISPKKELPDIKRFKIELAAKIGVPITYANFKDLPEAELPTQFDVCRDAGAITNQQGNAICTNHLKTVPFERFLRKELFNTMFGEECIIYYGYDKEEIIRIHRRKQILGAMGFKSDYPLAMWKERFYESTNDVGVAPPLTYGVWKHANCTGCLKAGLLHWYVTYVHAHDSFLEAAELERELDYSINYSTKQGKHYPLYLDAVACIFEQLKAEGFPATEHQSPRKFINHLKTKYGLDASMMQKPCECLV